MPPAVSTAATPPQPATFKHGCAFGPGDEHVAIDARPDVCAGQRHGLAQVERRCQLRDRVLPVVHFVQRGRLFEPFRQSLFTRTRTGDREQLEAGAPPEEVQVVGVQVMLVAEPLAWFTGADPAVLDPTEAEFVEADRTLSLIKRANDPGVAMQKHREEDDGRSKPPGGRSPAPPQGDQSNFREEREEPGAAEQAVARR